MLFAVLYSWLRLLLDLVDVRLRVHDPEAELLLLRHQLRVVRRQVKKPRLNMADRTVMAALSQRVKRSARVAMVVQPETVLGWHRELVSRRWEQTPYSVTSGFATTGLRLSHTSSSGRCRFHWLAKRLTSARVGTSFPPTMATQCGFRTRAVNVGCASTAKAWFQAVPWCGAGTKGSKPYLAKQLLCVRGATRPSG